MPSTLVHAAFGGLIGAALLGDDFDRRGALVVFAACALPDLDAFVALVSTAGHRTVGHTLLLPAALGVVIFADVSLRERSMLRDRWGDRGVRLAWVSLLAMVVAGIGLDLVTGGVNPLWPLHDQFYRVTGKVELSNTRGVVQTFVDLSPDSKSAVTSLGGSKEVHVSTGIDPTPGGESGPLVGDPGDERVVERVFPVVRSGWQLLVLVTGAAVSAVRIRAAGRR